VAFGSIEHPAIAADPSRKWCSLQLLHHAINDISSYSLRRKRTIVPSYASSSTLAKQIENGAPAEVFISADERG